MSLFFKCVNLPVVLLFLGLCSIKGNAQLLYNKQVRAKIKIDQNSEYATFTGIAENLTLSDFSLSYDFMTFNTDANGKVSKSSRSERFYIKQSEKVILSSTTISNNIDRKVILVLFIYDVNNKPIGKDRVVVNSDGNNNLIILLDEDKNTSSKRVAKRSKPVPNDGFFIEGFVVQKTLTKMGRDFYRYFYSEYYNKEVKSGKNILIKEVPGRGRGTKIMILVDNKLVWQFFSKPDKSYLKQMASFALRKCIAHLQSLIRQNAGTTHY